MKRCWLKALVALVVALALAALALQLSASRSRNAVEEYKAQLRAAGEKLDWKELAPARVEADKNSVGIFQQVTNLMSVGLWDAAASNPPPAMHSVLPGIAMISWQQPDIREFGTNSWAEIETGLAARRGILELLHEIPARSHLQFDLIYQDLARLPLSHLTKFKSAAQLLSTAAACDMHDGDTVSAVTNVHTSLALVNAWQDEPLLISQLVRIAMAQIAFSSQWELLQATNVNDDQLALLQNDCMRMDFIHPMERALEMERTFVSAYFHQMRSNGPSRYLWSSTFPGSSTGGSGDWLDKLKEIGETARNKTAESLWRASWSYADELNVLKGDQTIVETARQIQTNRFFKDAMADGDRKLKTLGSSGSNWFREKLDDNLRSLGTVDSVARSLNRLLTAEAAMNISLTAIALKRYELRHDKLPPDLNALVPEFLKAVPRDPVDGKPLRYRLNADGTFLLYSVGEDGVDDGGNPEPTAKTGSYYWLRGRDWVWPQPATAAEIESYEARSSGNPR